MHTRIILALTLWFSITNWTIAAPNFDRDVMSVLAKAGCNMGTCHGNLNGKGGFKLSLRGANPAGDYSTLTHGLAGRRINIARPEESLILLKATMAIPHEGGKRFDSDSVEYQIITDWLRAGATRPKKAPQLLELTVTPRDVVLMEPDHQVKIRSVATFADGKKIDVSNLAVYEPSEPVVDITNSGLVTKRDPAQTVVIVRYLNQQVPVRIAFIPKRAVSAPRSKPANFIDEHIFSRLEQLKLSTPTRCSDLVFLRRACLDLTGLLPQPDLAKSFLSDRDPTKRLRLIDDLLNSPEFADCWAQKWADLLRVEEKTLDRKGVQAFHAWLRNAVATNLPLNTFSRQLVTARGSTYTTPTANFYRAMRSTEMRAESTAQLFLGIRLQCAKCHNHPFDQWTQDDYYGWSNLFARIEYEVLENRRRDKNDQHEFDGEQIVWIKSTGNTEHPDGRVIPPRVLSYPPKPVNSNRDRLDELADWLTDETNSRFAEVHANRIWFHLLGRGLVEPIDDFRATNPPSHPELLAALGRELVTNKFDARQLIKAIMSSETYQFAETAPSEFNVEGLFATPTPRRLTAEQLADAACQVLGTNLSLNGYPEGQRAGQMAGVSAFRSRDKRPSSGDRFLTIFGKPPRLQACECERRDDSTLAQAFELVSGPLINDLLQEPKNTIGRMQADGKPVDEIITTLYLRTLSREPSEQEISRARQLVAIHSSSRQALEDLAWSLMNSNEFLFRR